MKSELDDDHTFFLEFIDGRKRTEVKIEFISLVSDPQDIVGIILIDERLHFIFVQQAAVD